MFSSIGPAISAAKTTAVDITQTCIPGLGGSGLLVKKHKLVEIADLDNPIGYKGNYIIFPLIGDCSFAASLLADFVDTNYGVNDPGVPPFNPEDFESRWQLAQPGSQQRQDLQGELRAYLEHVRQTTDEIIVPTGQLFIEALPGAHPLLEDFKLLHRLEDVRKVKAEVRRAELENLRLATRLVQGQAKPELLEDPDIEKKIIVSGDVTVNP
jgi:hypothetical protein